MKQRKVDYSSATVSWPRGQETVSLDLQFPGIECTAEEDKCRQEYALKTDISFQLQAFGLGRPMQYGAVDFDNLDLTRALELVDAAQQQWLGLPKVIRDRYQSWSAVESAARSGELEQVLKAAGVAAASAAAPAASASDSAPVDEPKGSKAS